MNALASSSTSKTLCSSLGAIRLSRRAYPATSSTSSSSSSSPARVRKPKWTRAQLHNRDYISIGLPPSSPNHEIAYAPIKRKKQRALEEARLLSVENASRDGEGKKRRDGTAWLSSQEFELKLYKEDLKERKKKMLKLASQVETSTPVAAEPAMMRMV